MCETRPRRPPPPPPPPHASEREAIRERDREDEEEAGSILLLYTKKSKERPDVDDDDDDDDQEGGERGRRDFGSVIVPESVEDSSVCDDLDRVISSPPRLGEASSSDWVSQVITYTVGKKAISETARK